MQAPVRSPIGQALREPLLHFLLIGVGVFLAFGLLSDEVPPDRKVIEVTPAMAERIVDQFEAVWRRPPSAAERAGLIEDYVREEVYYREALALGLDRDDTVIRRRLRQKMEFLADAGAGSLVPDEVELRAYFDAHPERFADPARVSFRQVFLGSADPAPALAALRKGADPADVGQGSLLPTGMQEVVRSAVDGTFGDGFFAAVASLPLGEWQGPVASGYGAHLVRLEAAEPAAVPPFDRVRAAVEDEWRRARAGEMGETAYRALLGRYEVVLPPIQP